MSSSKLAKCLEFFLDLTIFLLVSVFLFVPYIVLSFYKAGLVYYAKFFRGIELLPFEGIHNGGHDMAAIMLDKSLAVSNVSPKPNAKLRSNIGVLIKYEGSAFDIDKFRWEFYTKFIHEALDGKSRKYLNLVVHYFSFGGHIFRKRVDSIDINSHVYEVNLGERDQSVEEFCAQWLREPYRPGKPLWELVSIRNGTVELEESYFALKLHHGLADGFSISHMLEVFVGQESLQPLPETTSPFLKILLLIRTPRSFIKFVKEMAKGAKQKILKWSDPDDFSQHVVFGTLPIDKLKAVRKQFGVRFIPILQSLLLGAMRRLHSERELSNPSHVISASTLPWPCHPFQQKICNWGTMVVQRYPVSLLNSKDRLVAVDKMFQKALRDGVDRTECPTAVNLMSLLPFLSSDRGDTVWDLVWSPMVMKRSGYILWGRKVSNIFPLACLNARGIYVTAMSVSHGNQLDFVMSGSGQIFSHQQLNDFKGYLYDELDKLTGSEQGDTSITLC